MANPFGEIAGKIGAEVAEGLAKKAAPMVAKTAKKAVKAVEDKADDWGWKGGKPGELTGTAYSKVSHNLSDAMNPNTASGKLSIKAKKQLDKLAERKPGNPIAEAYGKEVQRYTEAKPTIGRNPFVDEKGVSMATSSVMRDFHHLEKADVPREYTGKIMSAFGGRLPKYHKVVARLMGDDPTDTFYDPQVIADAVSSSMRGLNKEQRDTFLTLLSDEVKSSNGMTLVQLANMAKNL